MGQIKNLIYRTSRKRAMHVTLLDPDPKKMKNLDKKIKELERFGTDAILIGGSTNVNQKFLDKYIKRIKNNSSLPVILFPGGLSGVSSYADAIFFMSLLNSRNPYWITGAQSAGARLVKEAGIEIIPMAYIIVEPGMKAGQVGEAEIIKRKDIKKAADYSLAAEYLGMDLVYLEAGSGADQPVPVEMVKAVRNNIEIPIIVGGGIRNPKQALDRAKAGADIIDTGTITEENFTVVGDIIRAVKGCRR